MLKSDIEKNLQASPPSAAANEVSKLRLEDAEAALSTHDCEADDYLAALIALARAAKREVRCNCNGTEGPGCILADCPDTAAELERWE